MRYILPPVSLEHRYLDIISGKSRSPLASLSRAALGVAELPYRQMMTARNARYDRDPSRIHDLGRSTISVGNITAGGTGKTPVVQWLAKRLIEVGHRPAILMRGYRKSGAEVSDEHLLLQNSLAMLVEANVDRIAGAAAALAREPQTTCFILDDAFQHRRARRDFDLVLINAVAPFGYDHVHPRGLLREPLVGLCRADAIVITHASERSAAEVGQVQDVVRKHCTAPIFHCDHVNQELLSADGVSRHELSHLANTPFLLFAGIGQPLSLDTSMKQLHGYRGSHLFGDHHHYTASDMAHLRELAIKQQATALVTTEKDWAKVAPLWAHIASRPSSVSQLYRLQLEVRFWENEQQALLKLIASKLIRR